MLEISVFCVMLLAAGYWTTMFIMGRRNDVIHGKFVHVDEEGDLTRSAMPAPPPFPKRPVKPVQPARQPSANELAAKPVNSEALQSLLAAIQQDLKSIA
ncbi:hypothetical protein C7U92_26460 [Bradyrhizobium sp. WBOS7]|uniref:Uncharacterized protein n=1 Tax=Bradyrhizobium betae TaxID=244734 RepID=A0AAE9NDQ1_9BRAD|nr:MULTISPECIES: hypothetical protein [Bradyrhizobium]MDD1573254.1 hypothetical protein [Bradyrhizobium sp. WBOS1]UUO37702.1 hypothetical protein DCK84_26055 [Bradyrhizobium sp. WBOS01]MDD1528264.1 hypothetical protein [Bradyrhizobium sp. WBOS2]MDD1580239.1 hypothetical protein [Bradyrhizobium sp. WBOS7]MDD1603445.1 hypothetical protein [Bradyrhizobium sp. WBOS16]